MIHSHKSATGVQVIKRAVERVRVRVRGSGLQED